MQVFKLPEDIIHITRYAQNDIKEYTAANETMQLVVPRCTKVSGDSYSRAPMSINERPRPDSKREKLKIRSQTQTHAHSVPHVGG